MARRNLVVPRKIEEEEDEESLRPKNLMREHGVLKRVLMIYRKVMSRSIKKDFRSGDVAAKLIRAFVKDYQEKLEEIICSRDSKSEQARGSR